MLYLSFLPCEALYSIFVGRLLGFSGYRVQGQGLCQGQLRVRLESREDPSFEDFESEVHILGFVDLGGRVWGLGLPLRGPLF